MFGFYFSSTELRVEKEVPAYPTMSFIAEIGGSLGLFIGFSFLTIWDCMEIMIERIRNTKKYFVYF